MLQVAELESVASDLASGLGVVVGQSLVAAGLASYSEVEQDTWLGEGRGRFEAGASVCREDCRCPMLCFHAGGRSAVCNPWLLYLVRRVVDGWVGSLVSGPTLQAEWMEQEGREECSRAQARCGGLARKP